MANPDHSLRQVRPEDWPDIAAQFADLTFEQTMTYGRAAAARIGADDEYWVLEDAGQPIAAAIVRIKRLPLLGRGIAWIASGPLMHRQGRASATDDEIRAILSAFRTEFGERQGHILRFRPAVLRVDSTLCDPASYEMLATDVGFRRTSRAPLYHTVVTNLDRDENVLMSALHGKWRGHLRKALKLGLEHDVGPIDELADRFEALYAKVSENKGFAPDIPPSFYYGLKGPDFEHYVLIAKKDGRDIGAITIGKAGQNAVYLFGATIDEGRRSNAGYYLTWNGYLKAREWNVLNYDLGGIDEENNPMVTEFKRRAGGTEILAPGPFEATSNGISARVIRFIEHLVKTWRKRTA